MSVMGIQKKLNPEKESEALLYMVREFIKLRPLSPADQLIEAHKLYQDIFNKKIENTLYKYGQKRLTRLFTESELGFFGYSDQRTYEVLVGEVKFLIKALKEKSLPSFIINLLAKDLEGSVNGKGLFRRLGDDTVTGLREILLDIRKATHVYNEHEKSIDKRISERVVERIVKSPAYTPALSAMIYHSEAKKMKKTYSELVNHQATDKNGTILESFMLRRLALEYLILLKFFKVKVTRQGRFPPKSTEALTVIQKFRDNGDELGKIYGEISKIFDPDYGQYPES
jgi:hypothetical protein